MSELKTTQKKEEDTMYQARFRIEGETAVITGGGRGIGRAIAAGLTQAGATVSILGRDEATLREAVAAGIA